jgi:hypothetical protein
MSNDEGAEDEGAARRQDSCARCGVARVIAVRRALVGEWEPLRLTRAGWICGYCVMRERLLAQYADELYRYRR